MIHVFVKKPEGSNLNLRFEQASVIKNGGTPGDDSGFDLMAAMNTPREIAPGQRWFVPTGVHLIMPRGCEAQVRTRSGLVRNHGFGPLLGTVDASYRGEISVTCFNLGSEPYTIIPGERIAQLVFAPVFPWCVNLDAYDVEIKVEDSFKLWELSKSTRGDKGFGSSGR